MNYSSINEQLKEHTSKMQTFDNDSIRIKTDNGTCVACMGWSGKDGIQQPKELLSGEQENRIPKIGRRNTAKTRKIWTCCLNVLFKMSAWAAERWSAEERAGYCMTRKIVKEDENVHSKKKAFREVRRNEESNWQVKSEEKNRNSSHEEHFRAGTLQQEMKNTETEAKSSWKNFL